jgi:hypothetical protein
MKPFSAYTAVFCPPDRDKQVWRLSLVLAPKRLNNANSFIPNIYAICKKGSIIICLAK